jgi:hypothetical protein
MDTGGAVAASIIMMPHRDSPTRTPAGTHEPQTAIAARIRSFFFVLRSASHVSDDSPSFLRVTWEMAMRRGLVGGLCFAALLGQRPRC